MIRRIVKLTFQNDQITQFLDIFEESKNLIRNFPGCKHLELWRNRLPDNIFFTFSLWEDENALEAYRHSELFKSTWEKTKRLFSDKPEAWSVDLTSETIENTTGI